MNPVARKSYEVRLASRLPIAFIMLWRVFARVYVGMAGERERQEVLLAWVKVACMFRCPGCRAQVEDDKSRRTEYGVV